MFKFESNDEENPKERNERYLLELILYFSKKTNNKLAIARQCGIAHRTLYKKIRKHKELAFLLPKDKIITRYDKKHLWRTKEL